MDTLLILRNVKVENANAISGLTWGFPAISNFLGFIHALSRRLPEEMSLKLEGCGVICHEHHIQAYQPRGRGEYVFGLTRNPLAKEGVTASFVEEGRMHMTISLVVPCAGRIDASINPAEVAGQVKELALSQRLAGGTVVSIGAAELLDPPEEDDLLRKFERIQLRKLLPGFALVQRADLLAAHIRQRQQQEPDVEALDAWLDFATIKFQAVLPEAGSEDEVNAQAEAEWQYIPKPGGGWLVPVASGYRGISDLYAPGEVACSRDTATPFRFVESAYSIGEWLSPHRVTNIEQLVWRYSAEPESGWYLCTSNYQPKIQEL
jgi:CRISPR-associated protein Csy2